MKLKSTIPAILLLAGLLPGLSSCEDFFNQLPLNDIVLEAFYTEENDITSVVTSCYAALESEDCITRMAVWGEMRSDNITSGSGLSNEEVQMLKENITSTSKYANWVAFYNVINRCNTVIHYAPLVNEKDPNYTVSEMKANLAEVKAIRALCYFYLIRTFRDVPFVTEPSIDDLQDYRVAATPFSEILDYLIQDLESVKDDAVRRYASEVDNTSRFTRYSISALLADLYLWKGDYQKCIEHCDLVIDSKRALYNETINATSNTDLELFKNIPLISEHPLGNVSRAGNAASKIFGMGNSFESILELSFERNQSVENAFVSKYYGSSSSSIGFFSVPPFLRENLATGANKIFKNTDCRPLEFIEASSSTQYAITKYNRLSYSFETPVSTSASSPLVSYAISSDNYANWILYRLSDIVLMKAEASVQLGKSMVSDTMSAAQSNKILKPYMQTAFTMVQAVFNRANNKTAASTDTLKFADYSTISAMENLVLLERHRELLFEGKRWFDLVRFARREGKNDNLVLNAIRKQTSNAGAIEIKLSSTDGIYFPISESELKLNPLLRQNPAYATDETSSISE